MTPPPPSSPAQTGLAGAHRPATRGVVVLGMHRSGTSVVTGVLERLGLDGGPRETMLAPDEFNSDGYWEQRPLVDWHDAVLTALGGWASAPPPITPASACAAAHGIPTVVDRLPDMFDRPWFLKDPRQCLLLPVWDDRYGTDDVVVVVTRHPHGVVASLSKRNNYSTALASALWERYNHDLLSGVRGRSGVVVRYEALLADPATVVGQLAEAVAPVLGGPVGDGAVHDAVALVRASDDEPAARPTVGADLWDLIGSLEGSHDAIPVPGDIPAVSSASAGVIERRRRRLNRIRPFVGSSAGRAAIDRIPARLRDLLGRQR